MNTPAVPEAPPGEFEWLALGKRIEQATEVVADDPLVALTALVEVEDDASTLIAQVMEHAVRQARQTGKTWAEIAAATGVKDRQAAWRRWTDRGIR